MSDRILFLDLSCPTPYDQTTLESLPMGGTEATVVRLAEALAASGLEVIVAQHNRLSQGEGLANYTSFEGLDQIHKTPKAVVALRTPKLLPYIQNRWPNAKRYIWAHDFNQQEFVEEYDILHESGVKIIAVSRYHKSVLTDALLSQVKEVSGVTVDFIYNPVQDTLLPMPVLTEQHKLVYFSSPHKGIERTLKTFENIRALDDRYTLSIANPGYLPDAGGAPPEGVTNLGSLTHAEMMRELGNAFAVLHLNDVFPETFGLVHAEANAMGVPVITHRFGANAEVLTPAGAQLLDVKDEKAVIERLQMWQRQGRPVVNCKNEFRLSAVVSRWKKELLA